jgi:hypothetical protein
MRDSLNEMKAIPQKAFLDGKKMANEDASLLFSLLCNKSSSLKTEGFLHIFTKHQRRLTC